MKGNRKIIVCLLLGVVLLIGTGVGLYLSDGYRADGGDHWGGYRGIEEVQQYILSIVASL